MSGLVRIGIMILSVVVTSITLHSFARLISDLLAVTYDAPLELLAVTGMILFQLPFLYHKPRTEQTRYYYHMLLVSLCGSLLLCPALAVSCWLHISSTVYVCWFLAVVTWMFLEHRKRVRRLQMPAVLSYTWLTYRLLLLMLIL